MTECTSLLKLRSPRSPSESNAHGKRSNCRSTTNDRRDEQIEGASSGSTATSSSETGANSNKSQDGWQRLGRVLGLSIRMGT